MKVEILHAHEVTDALQFEVYELYKQLNDNVKQMPLKAILENNGNLVLALCYEEKKVVGMAMMATYKVISGHKGMIEDVIVDEGQRGKGIGRKLMEKLLAEGKKRQLTEILLFSGHHRTTAIQLYKSLGFNLKDSGLYRLTLG